MLRETGIREVLWYLSTQMKITTLSIADQPTRHEERIRRSLAHPLYRSLPGLRSETWGTQTTVVSEHPETWGTQTTVVSEHPETRATRPVELLTPIQEVVRRRACGVDLVTEGVVIVGVGGAAKRHFVDCACRRDRHKHRSLVISMSQMPRRHFGHLKVFFSQHGTRGVARVYVDLHGFAFVGIRPGFGIFLSAKFAAVVAHLLFWIVVDVGERGLVVGVVRTGIESQNRTALAQ